MDTQPFTIGRLLRTLAFPFRAKTWSSPAGRLVASVSSGRSRQIYQSAGFGVVARLLALAVPIAFQVLIDRVLPGKAEISLWTIVAAVVLVSILEITLSFAQSLNLARALTSIGVELQARLYRHLLRLPLDFFKSRSTGEIVQRTGDLEQARVGGVAPTISLLTEVPFFAAALAMIFFYSSVLGMVALVGPPLLLVVGAYVQTRLRQSILLQLEGKAKSDNILVESIIGIETLKAFSAERLFAWRWDAAVANVASIGLTSAFLSAVGEQVTRSIAKFLATLFVLIGGLLVISGQLSLGEFVAAHLLTSHVVSPVLAIVQQLHLVGQFEGAVARLDAVVAVPGEPTNQAPARAAAPPLHGTLTFDDVTFEYSSGRRVLNRVSFEIAAGKVATLVGPSGVGKTTLLRLIQRLYTPTSGKISVDGTDLGLLNLDHLRSQLAVVGQESTVFAGTLLENLTLGQDPPHSVDDLLQLPGISRLVGELPDGLASDVGDRGSRLSGGQRRRIALARALLRNAPIILLDEPFNALDPDVSKSLVDHLNRKRGLATILLVTHDVQYALNADLVLVLSEGGILESDSPKNLIQMGGWFAKAVTARDQRNTA
ncbi:MAG: peptidase domain-containing ABC transporter [Pirellulaceae bacterium]